MRTSLFARALATVMLPSAAWLAIAGPPRRHVGAGPRRRPAVVTYEVVVGAGHNLTVAQLDMTALDTFLDRAITGNPLSARATVRDGNSPA
jgi:hypothetical protein